MCTIKGAGWGEKAKETKNLSKFPLGSYQEPWTRTEAAKRKYEGKVLTVIEGALNGSFIFSIDLFFIRLATFGDMFAERGSIRGFKRTARHTR